MLTIQKNIIDELNAEWNDSEIHIIYGKSGCGKSYLAQEIIAQFQAEQSKNIAFYLQGDSLCENREYYAFKECLSDKLDKYYKKIDNKKLTSNIIKEIPTAGEFLNFLYENAMFAKDKKQEQLSYILDNSTEMDIILKMRFLAQSRKSLVVVDNFQYLDIKSIELLNIILEFRKSSFAFFKDTIFLLFITTDESQTQESFINKILKREKANKYYFHDMEYSDFLEALNEFDNKKDIDEHIKKIIYKLSSGHLEVIKNIVKKINSSGDFTYNEGDSKEKILDSLIQERLQGLGDVGKQISELLKYASFIGLSFPKYEVERLIECSHIELSNLIDKSDEICLTTSDKKNAHFTHDLIRMIFAFRAKKDKAIYSSKMAVCVKELYPSEYYQRMEYELNSGNDRNSYIMASLALLQDFRLREKNISHNSARSFTSINPLYNSYIEVMEKAFEKYYTQKYFDVIKILEKIEPILPVELLAEKDLLLSLVLTKTLNQMDRIKALEILKPYRLISSVNNEFDLWLRIMMTYMTSSIHLGQRNEALHIEKELYIQLSSKLGYDDNAIKYINILRRRSNAIHDCNISKEYMRSSVDYFANMNCKEIYPVQYFLCLNNYIGVLCQCGDFGDAGEYAILLQHFIMHHRDIQYPRMEIFVNNYLLALLFSNKISTEKCLEIYNNTFGNNLRDNADQVFLLCNLSVLYMRMHKYESAYKILDNLYNNINFNNDNEAMYAISIRINLAIALAYISQTDKAKNILNDCLENLQSANYKIYIEQKILLLIEFIDKNSFQDHIDVEDSLFNECSFYQDNSWKFFGKTFHYSLLFYWSDL